MVLKPELVKSLNLEIALGCLNRLFGEKIINGFYILL